MALLVEDRVQRVSISAAWDGTGTAPAGSVVTVSSGAGSVLAVEITGTFVGTLRFEGTIDESTWFAITGTTLAGLTATSATATGRWFFQYAGLRAARVRCSAYTSGTPVITMNVSAGSPTGSASGGGGGGGAVTIADGADAAEGATTDAGIITDTSGTVIGFLRGAILRWNTFLSRLPAALVGGRLDVNIGAGTVGVTGLPTAAAMADGTANPTVTQIEALPMVWNGTTWDRPKDMAAANGLTTFTGVPVAAPVYLDTTGTPSVRRGVTAASTTGGVAGIQVPGSGSLVWDATVFRPQLADTSGRTVVAGAAAAGAAIAGNPLLTGLSDGTNARALLGNTRGEPFMLAGGFAPSAPTCTFTRPANTTAYTIGDEVGTASTAPTTISVARFNGAGGIIQGACAIYSNYPATVPQLVLIVFSSTVTLAGDNAQLALSDTDAAKIVAIIPLTSAQALNYSAGAPVSSGALYLSGAPARPAPHFVCGGSEQTLYCCLITLNAFTPIANSETIVVCLDVEQN